MEPINWPNPFNPFEAPTQIGFFLEGPAGVRLRIYTLEGDLVYEESRREISSGNIVWLWSGRNGMGTMIEPGGYIVMIEKRYSDRTERQKFKIAIVY